MCRERPSRTPIVVDRGAGRSLWLYRQIVSMDEVGPRLLSALEHPPLANYHGVEPAKCSILR
jgi:hypothetical protein